MVGEIGEELNTFPMITFVLPPIAFAVSPNIYPMSVSLIMVLDPSMTLAENTLFVLVGLTRTAYALDDVAILGIELLSITCSSNAYVPVAVRSFVAKLHDAVL